MTGYKTLLVGVDLEGAPEQVLAKAKALADPSTVIHLLSVPYDPIHFYTSYAAAGGFQNVSSVSMQDQAKQHDLERLGTLLQECDLNDAIPMVEFGRASEVIIKQAEKLRVDLIVVGSHGRHGVRLLLGSTANAVLHRAKCDVLAVRIRED